jgi:hypothetical protein
MDLSGFVQFGMDLAGGDEAKSVSPEHTALLFVLCWKFKAKSFGNMGIEGFVAGCEAIKCSTIEEIASRSGALLAEVSSSSKHVDPSRRSAADDRFQTLHSYVYDILRPDGKKYIEKVSGNAGEHMHAYTPAYTTCLPVPSPNPFCLASL